MKVAGIAPIITIGAGPITTESQGSTIMWTRAGETITEPIAGTAANGTTNASPAARSRDMDNRDRDMVNRDMVNKDMNNRDTIETKGKIA